MAKVFIEETTLTSIGNAIRGKEGTTELIPTTEMASRITAIQGGSDPVIESLEITSNGTYTAPEGVDGYSPIKVSVPQDGAPTDEELTIKGACAHRFRYGGWDWFIEKYGDRITTKDITNCNYMFSNSNLEEIPFQINVTNASNFSYMLSMYDLRSVPKVRGTVGWSTSTDFSTVFGTTTYYLRDAEDLFTPEMIEGFSNVKVTSTYSCPKPNVFNGLRSLRQIPSWWYKFKLNEESTAFPNTIYALYKNMIKECTALDEALNIPVWTCQGAQTSDMFGGAFEGCYRAKNITFETNEDGTPIVAQWKSQLVELHSGVGHATDKSNSDFIIRYNSGITADKVVTDDATYQALKDDPDWYTYAPTVNDGATYSRYNHDSAVATINSLPDTSAYLASAGGTNTIKFRGSAGSATDGGAINTLTEEEIAVATAKGWTVTLV